MAHMNQAKKQTIASVLATKLAKYDVKYSLKVRDETTIIMTVKSGTIDFFGEFNQHDRDQNTEYADHLELNKYPHIDQLSGNVKEFIDAALEGLNTDNYTDMDSEVHTVGHYVELRIGQVGKPYNFGNKPSAKMQAKIEQKRELQKKAEIRYSTVKEIKNLMKMYSINKEELI